MADASGAMRRPIHPAAGPLSVVLLVASVVSLIVVTTAVQIQNQRLQRQIVDRIAPAATAVKDVEVAIALQMAAIHAYARTRDVTYLDGYNAASIRERRAVARLSALMPDLQPAINRKVSAFSIVLDQWHSAVRPTNMLVYEGPAEEQQRQIQEQQQLYQNTLTALLAVEGAIGRATNERRTEIDASERLDWYFTIVLCLAALIAGLVIIWLDRRIRMIAQMAELRRLELERLLEARAGLMRGLSHDIRNPLGAVEGYAHILKSGTRGEMNDSQRDILGRIERALRASLSLLDGVIELSHAGSGKLTIHHDETNLVEMLQQIVEDHQANVEIAELTLKTEWPKNLPVIRTDHERVRRVVDNLLSNAIKYTPPGGTVTLTASATAPGEESGLIRIAVEDTGPGIPPEEQERIFEEFYRMPGSRGTAKGLGVGLAISRTLARLLGGDLTVTSREGQGSSFVFTLPAMTKSTKSI